MAEWNELLKMVVIDDEIWALRGFVSLLDWNALGFQIVGAYQDEEEAYGEIQKDRPDVIVTDVYLANSKGDAFLERVLRQFPETETVMISAHRDFEAVRSGMALGTFSYILKPYKREDVQLVFLRLYEKMTSRKNSVRIRGAVFTADEFANYRVASKSGHHYLVLAKEEGQMEVVPEKMIMDRKRVDGIGEVLWVFAVDAAEMEALRRIQKEGLGFSRDHYSFSDHKTMLYEAQVSCKYQFRISNDPDINKVQFYILDHLHEELTMAQLAQEVYLSPVYLSAKFKRHMGENLIPFVNRLKVREAMQLIQEGSLSLSDIAVQTGFSNYTYFGKMFKRYVCMTPEEYRSSRGQIQ